MGKSRFEIYKDARNEWRFRMIAGNGEIVATSEGYSTKAAAVNGIDSIRNNASEALIEEVNE